jgi:hypothetical protein
MLRTLSESSKASMMTTLLTRCGSYQLRSDDFISAAASQLEPGSGAVLFPPTAGPGASALCCVVEMELLSSINPETPGNGGAEELRIKSEAEESEGTRMCNEEMNGTYKTKGRNDSILHGLRGAFG